MFGNMLHKDFQILYFKIIYKYIAFIAELLDGCLRNFVGLKNSWPLTCDRRFCQIRPGHIKDGTKIGQGGPLLQTTSS